MRLEFLILVMNETCYFLFLFDCYTCKFVICWLLEVSGDSSVVDNVGDS